MSDCQLYVSPPKLLLISNHPTDKKIDKNDEMLPEQIQEPLNRNKVKKIVYYEKTARFPACSMVT